MPRVLVLDSMPTNQLIVKTLLAKSHFVCDVVGNVAAALVALETVHYDFVLTVLLCPTCSILVSNCRILKRIAQLALKQLLKSVSVKQKL